MTKKNQNRFWFLFVMLILGFGISMVIWTVKQAMSVPVHESNNYMLKYQMADMNINKIMELEAKFNATYKIELQNKEFLDIPTDEVSTNIKRVQIKPIKLLAGLNSFKYQITKKDGSPVENAKVTFLLTRPHTRDDDKLEENLSFENDYYISNPIELSKEGRYTLFLKVEINTLVGYKETPAYLITK